MIQKPKLFLYFFLFVTGSCEKQTIEVKNQNADVLEFYNSDSLSPEDKLYGLNRLLGKKNPDQMDSIYFEALSKKSLIHFNLKKFDSFYVSNALLFKKAVLNKNDYFLGKSSFNLAYYHDELYPKYDSAFYYYNISKNAFLEYGDTISAGKKLLNMGIIQKNKSDFFGAKESLTEALRYLSSSGDKNFLASVYNELAISHQKLLNFDDALKYYQKAITKSENAHNITVYKNNLALYYSEKGDFIEAEKILNEIMSEFSEKENSKTFARILHNSTYFQWKNGTTNLIKSFLQAKEIRFKQNDLRGLITSHFDLAEFYMSSNPNLAKKYLDTSIAISKQIKMPTGELNALRRYVILKPKDFEKRNRLTFLIDSLHRQELNAKTQFAKMKYDDEQEKARLLALETETAQKELQLARQKTQKILYLSLRALFLMAGVSLYFMLRQRHKKEKLVEVYKTEKRISQRLHDGLANDIFGLMAELEHEPDPKNQKVLDGLGGIYERTRDISHENGAVITGRGFAEEVRSLLRPYHTPHTTIALTGLDDVAWEKVPGYKCVALHRSLKELLVNMKKHSKATLVGLTFAQDRKQLFLTYNDNGIGCPPDQKYGLGLQNMENRIRGCNGSFTFTPTRKKGVQIKISVPF